MSALAPLLAELDAWGEAGRTAHLWWRDDDAATVTPALETMLAVRATANVSLAMAVLPMAATEALAARLGPQSKIVAWQHGIHHVNRATLSAKRQELTDATPATLQGLREAAGRLGAVFGPQAQAVLVPPWNRIADSLVLQLPRLGFSGLSMFAPRRTAAPAAGLVQINTHVDLLDWRCGAMFRGKVACVDGIVAHLQAKRSGQADPDEPTGLLSHHLVMQSDSWDFLAELFAATNRHPFCTWILPLFAPLPPEPA